MTTASEGVVLPAGGVISEPIPFARVSPGLSTCWTNDGGAFDVATLLKALLVETLLGQAAEGLPLAWRGGSMQVASLKGVAELMRRRPTLCRRPGVASCLSGWLLAADCGGWHCFAAVGAAWDSVRGRRLRQ